MKLLLQPDSLSLPLLPRSYPAPTSSTRSRNACTPGDWPVLPVDEVDSPPGGFVLDEA